MTSFARSLTKHLATTGTRRSGAGRTGPSRVHALVGSSGGLLAPPRGRILSSAHSSRSSSSSSNITVRRKGSHRHCSAACVLSLVSLKGWIDILTLAGFGLFSFLFIQGNGELLLPAYMHVADPSRALSSFRAVRSHISESNCEPSDLESTVLLHLTHKQRCSILTSGCLSLSPPLNTHTNTHPLFKTVFGRSSHGRAGRVLRIWRGSGDW